MTASTTVDRLRFVPRRSLLPLDAVPGMRLRVEKGQVWITMAGSPEDHVLGPGQWLLPRARGRMLVYAFEPAMVSVSTPVAQAAPAVPRRLAGLAAALRRSAAAVAVRVRGLVHAPAGPARH